MPALPTAETSWNLFGGDEGAVAGYAAPDAVATDPGVGVTGADYVFLSFVDAGLAVDAVDHGCVAAGELLISGLTLSGAVKEAV